MASTATSRGPTYLRACSAEYGNDHQMGMPVSTGSSLDGGMAEEEAGEAGRRNRPPPAKRGMAMIRIRRLFSKYPGGQGLAKKRREPFDFGAV